MLQFRKARALFTFPKKLSDEFNGHFKVRKGTRPLQEAHTKHSRWQVFLVVDWFSLFGTRIICSMMGASLFLPA